jgi:hypothetical protein
MSVTPKVAETANTSTTETGAGPAGAVFDPGETIAHGAVHLDVTDLPRAVAFWRDLLGLTDLGGADGVARLGTGGRELIVLHAGAVRGPQRGHSGLYHVALHLPDERGVRPRPRPPRRGPLPAGADRPHLLQGQLPRRS